MSRNIKGLYTELAFVRLELLWLMNQSSENSSGKSV